MATAAELARLDYSVNPRQNGLMVDEYDAQFAQHGEKVRWWQCFPDCPPTAQGPNGEQVEADGCLYVEKVLSDDTFVLISNFTSRLVEEDHGARVEGSADIACNPEKIELASGDRIVLTSRLRLQRLTLSTSGEGSDSLTRPLVAEIVSVIGDGVLLPSTAYNLVQGDGHSASSIEWTGDVPDFALVTLRYRPRLVFLDASEKNPPRGADGKRLLQRGTLTLERK